MQSSPEISRSNISRFLCENCGANMAYDAQAGGLLCPYCQHTKAVEISGSVDEHDYDAFIERGTQALQPMAVDAMQVNCDSCGAIVNFTPPETARVCDFCGAKIVAQPKSADPLIAPEGVLPFRVNDKTAAVNLKKWLSSRWFAPSKLKSMAETDAMSSIYIPYWTYDAWTESDYTGMRGVDRTEIDTYTENGETKTRTRTVTDWYPASGHISRGFDDVLIAATLSLPDQYLDALEPWDLEAIAPYEPAYLSGHKAQAYQVPLDGGFEIFKQVAYNEIESDCRSDIGGNHQRVNSIDTQYSNITFKHLLLPVYASAYRFRGKIYQVVVNGRTGEVQGSRPYSWVKIASLILFIALAVYIIFQFLK